MGILIVIIVALLALGALVVNVRRPRASRKWFNRD